jgi:hypothetical protein
LLVGQVLGVLQQRPAGVFEAFGGVLVAELAGMRMREPKSSSSRASCAKQSSGSSSAGAR